MYSIGDVKSSDVDLKRHSQLSEEGAIHLDLLHLQKMRQSRVVCFLNLLQHLGVSTWREYAYAKRLQCERGSTFTILFAEVTRIVVEDGSRIDYHLQFIEDPFEAGLIHP